jgi:RyR domain-containing protein
MTIEQIAQVCHEANRAVQVIQDDPAVSPHWKEAPEWQKISAIEGVQMALSGATPEQLHESWCQEKHSRGWVYGIDKNPVNRTHPCLVPYASLPADQIAKDVLFQAIVKALSE